MKSCQLCIFAHDYGGGDDGGIETMCSSLSGLRPAGSISTEQGSRPITMVYFSSTNTDRRMISQATALRIQGTTTQLHLTVQSPPIIIGLIRSIWHGMFPTGGHVMPKLYTVQHHIK